MKIKYILGFVIALLLMLVSTPKIIKLAKKINFIEQPDPEGRKIHTEPKPYLASIGIFCVFWLVYLALSLDFSFKTLIFFTSSLIIFLIGLVDDWYKINRKDLKKCHSWW